MAAASVRSVTISWLSHVLGPSQIDDLCSDSSAAKRRACQSSLFFSLSLSLSLCFCLLFVLTLGLANQNAQFPSDICKSNPLLGNTSCNVKDLTCKVYNPDRTKKSSFDLTCNVKGILSYFVTSRITNLSASLAAKQQKKGFC